MDDIDLTAELKAGFRHAESSLRGARIKGQSVKIMISQFYGYLGAIILLMTLGRILWRRTPTKVDWELIVAFVRLEFPPDQRDIAQKIAAGLAEIVGVKIKQLTPENTVGQIVSWAEEPVSPADLIKVLRVAFGVNCEADATFRSLVEKVAEKQQRSNLIT